MTLEDAAASPAPRPGADPLDALRRLDTCSVANAIEATGVRLRNEGYMDATVQCMFPELPPLVGYAMTLRVKSADPPVEGVPARERNDWWEAFVAIPEPRLLVIQGEPGDPASGSVLGEVHAHIYRSLGCGGVVTDGAIRDLPALRALRMPLFAGHVAVSHAYAHVVEAGAPVKVGGLTIQPGDLIHGDVHGVLRVPAEVADRIPAIAARQRARERQIIDYCGSPAFSLEGLRRLLGQPGD
ncbi:MAG TPA: RraA family protein [Burkholderiales bacterium]|nr:RraA family protein [Burkholderiales bacterium]